MWILLILFILGMIGNSKEKKEKEAAENETLRRRKEAEDYIMGSGDPEAIKMLMLARANPANYSQVLAGGMNKGNDTLKTALGVMTGVVVGNLVANAITASAISSALENMQTELNSPSHDSLSSSDVEVDSGSDIDSLDV
jgi:hypothetical protein